MHASLRRAAITVADAATEGLDMITIVVGGAIGAWAGYTYSPDTWSGDWRLAFAGGIAVVAAVAVNSPGRAVPHPAAPPAHQGPQHRPSDHHAHAHRPARPGHPLRGPGAGRRRHRERRRLPRRLRRVADRPGRRFPAGRGPVARLRGRRGVLLPSPPGVWLHYRSEKNEFGHRKPQFTLLTGDGDQPVPINNVQEIRHQLAARAAGLPATPAADAIEDQGDVLDDDLTGLHATA
ncbi:hypothetical protein LT493_26175 [Streptomyces tricolor]|nr:hypothetical protein [Streptomyces tricolor]